MGGRQEDGASSPRSSLAAGKEARAAATGHYARQRNTTQNLPLKKQRAGPSKNIHPVSNLLKTGNMIPRAAVYLISSTNKPRPTRTRYIQHQRHFKQSARLESDQKNKWLVCIVQLVAVRGPFGASLDKNHATICTLSWGGLVNCFLQSEHVLIFRSFFTASRCSGSFLCLCRSSKLGEQAKQS